MEADRLRLRIENGARMDEVRNFAGLKGTRRCRSKAFESVSQLVASFDNQRVKQCQ